MYMSKMLSVGKCSNGFMVEVTVPFKRKPEKASKGEVPECYPGSKDKQFVAKGTKELAALIEKLLPLLEEDFSSEKEFDNAFDEAAGEMEKKGDED